MWKGIEVTIRVSNAHMEMIQQLIDEGRTTKEEFFSKAVSGQLDKEIQKLKDEGD